MLHPLVSKVHQFLERLGCGPGGLVVAVSGGPDSVALLRSILALRRESAAGPIVMAHLNHQLRGADSDADEAFVVELHTSLQSAAASDLLIRHERRDMAAIARARRSNLEDVARRLRYEWLAGVAAETGARWVATGHTADDQAETVLHRLLRGTGLQGLRGIAPRRPLAPGIELVRPLLAVTREEVLAYLHAEGQTYRTDQSNADLSYTRNRIRHELLPQLAKQYNPAVVSLLCRLAEQAEEVYAWQEQQARELLTAAELPRAGKLLVFDRQRLAAAPKLLVREALRLAWAREGWPLGEMNHGHWDRLAEIALAEEAAVDFPGGIRGCSREHVVQIGQNW